MNGILNLLKNIHTSPVTTIGGLLLAVALAVSHQPNWHSLLAAVGAALLGAIAKEK